jgi:hypothetical protein
MGVISINSIGLLSAVSLPAFSDILVNSLNYNLWIHIPSLKNTDFPQSIHRQRLAVNFATQPDWKWRRALAITSDAEKTGTLLHP